MRTTIESPFRRRSKLAFWGLLALSLTLPAGADPPAPTRFIAHLDAAAEVPANDSTAAGQAIFTLSPDGTELDYAVIVANIDNVTASHIHLAGAGVNGPVVAFLYGSVPPGGGRTNGVLATGTITAASLVGPLAGHALSHLIAALASGDAYVNVHTNDGVAPTNTGPGDLPGGEIRGQLRPVGPPH